MGASRRIRKMRATIRAEIAKLTKGIGLRDYSRDEVTTMMNNAEVISEMEARCNKDKDFKALVRSFEYMLASNFEMNLTEFKDADLIKALICAMFRRSCKRAFNELVETPKRSDQFSWYNKLDSKVTFELYKELDNFINYRGAVIGYAKPVELPVMEPYKISFDFKGKVTTSQEELLTKKEVI